MKIGGVVHEHITHVQWLDTETGKSLRSTLADMVDFADQGGRMFVGGEDGWQAVQVVRSASYGPYLRSVKDDTPTDNLLSLPRF